VQNLLVVLTNEKKILQLNKMFRVSFFTPMRDWMLMIPMSQSGGHVSAIVKSTTAFLGEDYIRIFCEADIRAMCLLHFYNMGWMINCKDDFVIDPDVCRELDKIVQEVKRGELPSK